MDASGQLRNEILGVREKVSLERKVHFFASSPSVVALMVKNSRVSIFQGFTETREAGGLFAQGLSLNRIRPYYLIFYKRSIETQVVYTSFLGDDLHTNPAICICPAISLLTLGYKIMSNVSIEVRNIQVDQ